MAMAAVYNLNLGCSPDGGFVHDIDWVGTFDSRAAAQSAAEQEAGIPLTWRWMDERQVWRVELGYERAAEISRCVIVEHIGLSVRLMP